MKKIFKALAITAATAALGTGIALASGCSTGYNGVYEGDYHYDIDYGVILTYGMKVRVTVKNNIITKVEDISPDDYITVSSANPDWGWTDESVANWTDNKAYLLQLYEGWAVSDILSIKVFIKEAGEPYEVKCSDGVNRNSQLSESGLLTSGATQGSGRLMLAIQNALGK